MSRANFFIILVLVAALAGMFFWTLSIHNRQAAIGGGSSSGGGPGADSEMASRVESLEERLGGLDQGQRALRADLGILETQVERIGDTTDEHAESIKALAAGGPVLAGSSVEGGGQLTTAIEQVLAEKEANERRERLGRMARGMSRWLLSEVDATDEQKDQFVKVITSYFEDRDRLRNRLEEEDADAQRREIAYAELDQQRNEKVVRIFGAADFAKIEERLNRTRRGMDGRAGRGPSRGGGGRR